MVWSNIHFLPIMSFLLLPSTFVLTYCISVIRGDVTIFFPYISDTGNRLPERCIFSQFVNLSAFLFMFTIYIRYKQIEQYCRDHLSGKNVKILRINYVSFVIGLISCLGLTVVANFQEIDLKIVHLTGAITCFTSGLLYCILQTWISFLGYPLLNTHYTAKLRLTLTTLMFCTYITALVLGPYAVRIYDGKDRTRWKPNEAGYIPHAIAAFAEWITMFCLNFFLLSYTREMHKISVHGPKVILTIDNVDLMQNNQTRNENYYDYETNVEVNIRTNDGSSDNIQSIIG